MKFYGTHTALMVNDNGQKEALIVARFMSGENQDKFHNYIDTVAIKLNEMEPFSDEMTKYLRSVEETTKAAQCTEKFLEEVKF